MVYLLIVVPPVLEVNPLHSASRLLNVNVCRHNPRPQLSSTLSLDTVREQTAAEQLQQQPPVLCLLQHVKLPLLWTGTLQTRLSRPVYARPHATSLLLRLNETATTVERRGGRSRRTAHTRTGSQLSSLEVNVRHGKLNLEHLTALQRLVLFVEQSQCQSAQSSQCS